MGQVSIERLNDAIRAAGQELQEDYSWGIDAEFYEVLTKHIYPLFGRSARQDRIKLLRAELATLEREEG